ncbi:MAG: spore coat U domain-containing protein [Burkholderiaceae bacterium]
MNFASRPAIRRLRSAVTALLLGLLSALLPGAASACTISATPLVTLGSRSSFDARSADLHAGSGGSGLSCPGLLGLLSYQYVFVSVDSASSGLLNAGSGDLIPFSIATTPGGTPLSVGSTSSNLAVAGLLALGGSNSDIQMFISLGAAGNIAAGTYTGTVVLRWHHATCSNISALNICIGGWSRSPGVNESCLLGLCTLNTGTLPGAGSAVTLTISLQVTRDCRFSTTDIDFGSAPLVSGFAPVNGTVGVNCTKGSTFSVGLSNGNHFDGGRRRMASGASRLQYDVFRPGNVLWNAGSGRAVQATPAPGDSTQNFPFTARIYGDQPTPPVGHYVDTLIVDVQF